MYDLYPATRPYVINASNAYRILAEIKTYLMMLKAESSQLLAEIRDFTRSFGPPYDTFEIDDYVSRVSDAAATGMTRQQILDEPRYGIALPPKAVADYIERIWGWKTTVTESGLGSGGGDGVIGVGESAYSSTGAKKLYNGLEHYMYRSGGKIYSWGESFNSVKEAADSGAGGAQWQVCYVISATRP
jgi:hypothetical protein